MLVDDAAARRVDDPHARLHLAQRLFADESDRVGRLRQVHGDEVRLGEQLVEGDHPDAELRGACGLDVGVVGHEPHAERREPLGDEQPDAPEADDADGLVGELDAGELRALPLAGLERGARGRDVAGAGEQQGDGELRGAHDVRGRGVDDHDAGLRGGLDVDVVEADAGARHDLEPRSGGDGLGVDLRGRADEDRVDVGDGRQQCRPVRAVDVTDLEVGAEGLDGGRGQLFGDEDDRLAHGGT